MASLVLTTLSLFMGVFFVLMGAIKVTQLVHRDLHREVRRQFVRYAKVLPTTPGLEMSPKLLRLSVGWLEVCSGLAMAFVPIASVKLVANCLLVAVTVGGVYTHLAIGDPFQRIAPSLVFTLMLCCRLVVHYQQSRRRETTVVHKKDN